LSINREPSQENAEQFQQMVIRAISNAIPYASSTFRNFFFNLCFSQDVIVKASHTAPQADNSTEQISDPEPIDYSIAVSIFLAIIFVDLFVSGATLTEYKLRHFAVNVRESDGVGLEVLYHSIYHGIKLFGDKLWIIFIQATLLALVAYVKLSNIYYITVLMRILGPAVLVITAFPIAKNVAVNKWIEIHAELSSRNSDIKFQSFDSIEIVEKDHGKFVKIGISGDEKLSEKTVLKASYGDLEAGKIPKAHEKCLRKLYADDKFIYAFPAYLEPSLSISFVVYSIPIDNVEAVIFNRDGRFCG
jgi:hypothetical protein